MSRSVGTGASVSWNLGESRRRLPVKPGEIRSIRIDEIDQDDTRFQFRLSSSISDLRRCLEAQGQQVPVTLWGAKPPYMIIDGFRRIEALEHLRLDTVMAIVRKDLGEDEALALSFTENAQRRNYSSFDRAHAIWVAIHSHNFAKSAVCSDFGLSERQVNRYLNLLDLEPALSDAVHSGKISMAHAAVIHRTRVKETEPLIERVQREGLSAGQLGRLLRRNARGGRRKRYIVRDGDGFRAYPFEFRPTLDVREKRRILEALEQAAILVRSSC